jgi:hypothetical protein
LQFLFLKIDRKNVAHAALFERCDHRQSYRTATDNQRCFFRFDFTAIDRV